MKEYILFIEFEGKAVSVTKFHNKNVALAHIYTVKKGLVKLGKSLDGFTFILISKGDK